MTNVPGETLVEEITIQAPARRIFAALTDPAELVKWWGVEGRFQMTEAEVDLRPGGKWTMRGTGMGAPRAMGGEYREIEPPRLLVYTWLPSWQADGLATLVRWELEERYGATTVRLTHSRLASEDARASHRGWPLVLGALRRYAEVCKGTA